MFTGQRVVVSILAGSVLWGRSEVSLCGYHPWRAFEERDLSAKAARSAALFGRPQPPKMTRGAAQDIGDIAILEDSGGVVSRRNPFNLSGRGIRFEPTGQMANGYRFFVSDAAAVEVDPLATPLIGLGDDDSRGVALPFPFPFFGAAFQQLFVNSDGNLTFVEADSASTSRSVGRMLGGPPRIAPLFSDLDPSKSRGPVTVFAQMDKVVFTWKDVPVYTSTGIGPTQTFSVTLFAGGAIEMIWGGGNTSVSAVVGISPGRGQANPSIVTFKEGADSAFESAVVERFGDTEEIDLQVAALRFYQTHEDAYDYLVFYNTAGVSAGSGILAFANPVRDVVKGNGAFVVGDQGALYGSADKLKAVLNMGPLSQYPANPAEPVPLRFGTGDTSLTVLGHEAGHLFLAYTSVRNPANAAARPMLGRDFFHWSFFFNSEASLLEGNRIADAGEGASPRFRTVATVEGYSPLDQYLMALRPPEEVAPTFFVENTSIPLIGTNPRVGVQFDGSRRDVKLEEIIGVEGRLIPDYTISQRKFRFAFVLVVREGSVVNGSALDQLETLRKRFEAAFGEYTSGRAQAATTLNKNVRLSFEPYAGVPVGGQFKGFVELASVVQTDTELRMKSESGLVSVPGIVTIRAGSKRAEFAVAGLAEGVDQISAVVADSSFRDSLARVQVLGNLEKLSLKVERGDGQSGEAGFALAEPIIVLLSDEKGAPYAGRGLRVSAAGSDEYLVTTNEKGRVSVRWTPGTGPEEKLTLALEEAPTVKVTVTAKVK